MYTIVQTVPGGQTETCLGWVPPLKETVCQVGTKSTSNLGRSILDLQEANGRGYFEAKKNGTALNSACQNSRQMGSFLGDHTHQPAKGNTC